MRSTRCKNVTEAIEDKRAKALKQYDICSTMGEARAVVKQWSAAQRQVDEYDVTFDKIRRELDAMGVNWVNDSSRVDVDKVLENYDQGLRAKSIYDICCHQTENFFAVLGNHFFEDEASIQFALSSRNYKPSERNFLFACQFVDQQKKLFKSCVHLLKQKAKQLDAQRVHEQFIRQIEVAKARKERDEMRILGVTLSPTPRLETQIRQPALALPDEHKDKKGISKTVNPLSLQVPLDNDIASISLSRSNSMEELIDFADKCLVQDEDEDEDDEEY